MHEFDKSLLLYVCGGILTQKSITIALLYHSLYPNLKPLDSPYWGVVMSACMEVNMFLSV